MLAASILYLITLIASLAAVHALLGVSGLGKRIDATQRLAVSTMATSLFQAWIFSLILRILPGQSSFTYALAVTGICLIIAVALRQKIGRDFNSALNALLCRPGRSTYSALNVFGCFVLVLFFGIVAVTSMMLPPSANDPLEYLTVARAIFENKALTGVYPLTNPDLANGFYAAWTHPPGFSLILAWPMFVQGSAKVAGAATMANVFNLFAFSFLVYAFAGQARRYRGIIAALIVALTPILLFETYDLHVDVVRIGIWTAVILLFASWIQNPDWKSSLFFGLCSGLAIFAHSIGWLVLGISAGLIAVFWIFRGIRNPQMAWVAFAAAVAVVLPDLIINLIRSGSFVADTVPVWEIEELNTEEHLRSVRGISNLTDIVLNGFLRVYWDWALLGPAHGLMLLLVVINFIGLAVRRKIRWSVARTRWTRPNTITVGIWTLIGFSAIVALSILLEMELIVKNPRYLVTMIGIATIILVWMVDKYIRLLQKRIARYAANRDRQGPPPQDARLKGSLIYFLWNLGTKEAAIWSSAIPRYTHFNIAMVLLVTANVVALLLMLDRFSIFSVNNTSKWFSEQRKIEYSQYPQFRLIQRFNKRLETGAIPADSKVLSFRAAGTAYYGNVRMVSWADPSILSAYSGKSAEDVYDKLREEGITHLFTPPYSTVEYLHSGLKHLLSDPSRVQIEDSSDGYFLYKLLDTPSSPETEPVLAQNRPNIGSADFTEFVSSLPARRTYSGIWETLGLGGSEEPGLRLRAEQRWRSVYESGWVGLYYAAGFRRGFRLLSVFQSPAENGEYLVGAKISGSGYARISMAVDKRLPVLIWEGVLPSEPQSVSRLVEMAHVWDVESSDLNRRSGKWELNVDLEVLPGTDFRVHDVKIERVKREKSIEVRRVDALSGALKAGTSMEIDDLNSRFLSPSADMSSGNVNIDLADGRRLKTRLPFLAFPYEQRREILENFALGSWSSIVVEMDLGLSGSTLADMRLAYRCLKPNDVDLANPERFKKEKPGDEIDGGGKLSVLKMDKLIVTDYPLSFRSSQVLPCVPERVALLAVTERAEREFEWKTEPGHLKITNYIMNLLLRDATGRELKLPLNHLEETSSKLGTNLIPGN
ncbi:MAG: glycosyltransferase family 39 protein [Pseudomonadota bacterium]